MDLGGAGLSVQGIIGRKARRARGITTLRYYPKTDTSQVSKDICGFIDRAVCRQKKLPTGEQSAALDRFLIAIFSDAHAGNRDSPC
jgi:hypothetical protein